MATSTSHFRSRRASLRVAPQQARSLQTRERLLDVAGQLLGEVGIESITTNLICARAGMTPPALYRYFKDKYAILEALGRRFMDRQNAVLFAWLEAKPPREPQDLSERVEQLLQRTADVTAAEPGAVWILRALRAVPQLAHVRIESHRLVTDKLTEAYAPLFPELPRKVLWRRLRIAIEIGFAIDEMRTEEDRISRNDLLRETARLMRWSLTDPLPSPDPRPATRKRPRKSPPLSRKRTTDGA
jgi:AcrR family transcriptional regulator